MASVWFLCARRWLVFVYGFVFCTLMFYMISYSKMFDLMQVIKWPQHPETPPQKLIPCQPRQNIVFLKQHKCASSSVQNVLMRYANRNNLTLVLPLLPKQLYFPMVKPFRKEMLAGAPWEILGYNILCHHMVFDKNVVEKIMPKDTVYISIIRNPVNLFESLYEYDDLEEFYHLDIEEFARATKNASVVSKLKVRSNGMGRNQMLYDFGIHPVYFSNQEMVKKSIEILDNQFDFIMIAEYFDESIVILKHILCWELDDVVSLTINERMDNYRKNLSTEAIQFLEDWNWGDKMLYNHFLNKFKKTVAEFGAEQLKMEVEELRYRRNEWFDYCVRKKVEAKNLTSYKIWSNKVSGYIINPSVHNETCHDMVKPEKYFTSELRQKQLLKSLMKNAPVPNYGPFSLKRLIDYKYWKGKELLYVQNLLMDQHKYRRKLSNNKFKET